VTNIRRNSVSLSDSWFGFSASKNFNFFDLEVDYFYFRNPLYNPLSDYPSSYWANYFLEDEQSRSHDRHTLSLIVVLAEIGGLMEIITMLILLIIGPI
jgi:hypothetical protein